MTDVLRRQWREAKSFYRHIHGKAEMGVVIVTALATYVMWRVLLRIFLRP